MNDFVEYADSYGRKVRVHMNKDIRSSLRPRKLSAILSEVEEVVERIKRRGSRFVSADAVSLELCVRPDKVMRALHELSKQGKIGQKITNESKHVRDRAPLSKTVYETGEPCLKMQNS